MKEIWKDIPGYEGYYQVSNFGRVRSLTVNLYNGFGYYDKAGKLLKPSKINSGRLMVNLSRGGICKRFLVHRLVLLAFLGEVDGKSQVNHIDGNPLNNRLDNLEWCNQSENEKHKIYKLRNTNGALLAKPRKVICKETNTIYPSLAEACRQTGIKMHILFNRLKTGNTDNDGNHWEYVI